ncbi:unnamed protein product [Rhodiola kirilowii]
MLSEYQIIDVATAIEKKRSRRLSTSIFNQVVPELEASTFKATPWSWGGKRGCV